MRSLALILVLSACAQPSEEPCLISSTLTDGEAADWVANGRVILIVTGSECGPGACIRDRTVTPGDAGAAALGYCAPPCGLGCVPEASCEDVNGTKLCLRKPR